MKIAKIELTNTARCYLRHPATQQDLLNSKGERLWIEGFGAHTEQYKRITRQWQNETLRNRKIKVTAEQLEQRTLNLLSSIVSNWNIEDDNGKPLAVSADNARGVFVENPWAKDQFDDWVHEQGNYVGESFAA